MFLAPLEIMLLPYPVCEYADVIAAFYQFIFLNLVELEQVVVAVARVVHARIDTSLI